MKELTPCLCNSVSGGTTEIEFSLPGGRRFIVNSFLTDDGVGYFPASAKLSASSGAASGGASQLPKVDGYRVDARVSSDGWWSNYPSLEIFKNLI